MGWGMFDGGDITHYLVDLTTPEAVEALLGGTVQLRAVLGVTVGPMDRSATSHVSASSSDWAVHPAYSYVHSQGFFVGMSLEGSVLTTKFMMNEREKRIFLCVLGLCNRRQFNSHMQYTTSGPTLCRSAGDDWLHSDFHPPVIMIIFLMLLASYTTLIFCLTVNILAFFLFHFAERLRYPPVGRTSTSTSSSLTGDAYSEENLQAANQID
jgi:hypothetical protein